MRRTTRRIVFVLVAVVSLTGVVAYMAPASGHADGEAAPIFGVKIPPGYRDWRLISVAHEEGKLNDLRAILGNDIAIKASREGKLPFPDGTIIARLAWSYDPLEESNKAFGRPQSFVAGPPKNGVQFMVKDSRKYASTGGWGFAQFNDGKPADEAVHNTCFSCHEPSKLATLSSTVTHLKTESHRTPPAYDHRRETMEKVTYDKEITALLVIDPYNDFISEGGKIWDRLKGVAEANNCVPHMLQVLNAARKAKLRVFYALHHRYRPGDYETWKYIAPIQKAAWSHKTFEYGTWGGEIRREFEPQPGDIVALEHWGSSGFANTDLDLQLKKHGIHQLIVMGLIAHTCVEATVRYAAELGYEVTMVKDATADYSDEEMHAALDVNIPNYASAIVTTDEVVDSISSL